MRCEHRPVCFLEDVSSYLDFEVRADPDDVLVKGGVVDLAALDPSSVSLRDRPRLIDNPTLGVIQSNHELVLLSFGQAETEFPLECGLDSDHTGLQGLNQPEEQCS